MRQIMWPHNAYVRSTIHKRSIQFEYAAVVMENQNCKIHEISGVVRILILHFIRLCATSDMWLASAGQIVICVCTVI